MHNALKDRLSSKHLQLRPKLFFQKTSGSYFSNSNILLQVSYKTLTTETASILKPSLPQLAAIETNRPHIKDSDHCYDFRTNYY